MRDPLFGSDCLGRHFKACQQGNDVEMAVGREEIIDNFDFVVGKIFETLNSTSLISSEVFVLEKIALWAESLNKCMGDFGFGGIFKVVEYCPDDAHTIFLCNVVLELLLRHQLLLQRGELGF